MSSELESFRVNKIDVCGRNGKDYAIGFGDVFRNEVARLFFDVGRLVPDGYLRVLVLAHPQREYYQPLSDRASRPASG